MNDKSKSILFDLSKNCQFTPTQGLKTLTRKLKTNGFKIISNKNEISSEVLSQTNILIISSPKEKYTELELNHLRKFLNSGGHIWVMLGEGKERKYLSNLNNLLDGTGININNDSVIRNSYFKYFHPKEALISNGILNRGLLSAANKLKNLSNKEINSVSSLTYIYPFGATLNVTKPGIAILSTGPVCYPLNRPTLAFYIEKINGGKLVVSGSSQMWSDNYIEKEDNLLIKDLILEFLTQPNFQLNQIDAENPEISDYHLVPDIELLAEEPFSCLQETEDIPSDHTKLFSKEIYQIDNTILAKVIAAYKDLNLEKEPLKLIKPQFEAPLPALKPAVFPPNFRSLPKPALELYDLDQAFSSISTRLTQISNKCTDKDLDYYIKQCGMILGINELEEKSSKSILEYAFNKIVLFKKVNDD